MEITEFKTLHMTNPLGIGVTPYFSWKLCSNRPNTLQTQYRLTVADPEDRIVMDTGTVEDSKNTYLAYAGEPLRSRCRYTVKVTIQDNYGNTAEGGGWFETALLSAEEWSAQWIAPKKKAKPSKKGFGKGRPATMFRQTFSMEGELVSARLYATCHGIYMVYLNGKTPDARVFAPEHTVYEKYLCYQTYDILPLLCAGRNAIGMVVGDGWYHCPNAKPNMKTDNQHAALYQIELVYRDGRRQIIGSDTTAVVSDGPVRSADLFAGELYDARKEQPDWSKADFDAAAWESTADKNYGFENLKAQLGEPVLRVAECKPVSVKASPKGETILDFGQNLAGWVRVDTHLQKDQTLRMEHCEVLDKDGNYCNNIMSAAGVGGCDQIDEFISNGKEETFEPRFTYHGFRFVRLTIDGKAPNPETVNPEDFTAVALSTQKEDVGSFVSSDDKLNRLYQNIRWSQRANMLSVPTDCPQREKAGWTGDMLVYAKTAMLNEDCTTLFSRWLYNMQCDQDNYGIVPMVVPEDGSYPMTGKLLQLSNGGKGKGTSAGWGDAAVIVPYSMYEVTGNTEILKQQYYCMRRWVDHIIREAADHKPKGSTRPVEIEQYLWDTGYHYGEWLIPSQNKNGLDMKKLGVIMKQSAAYTAPIFGWLSVSTFAEIAAILARDTADNALYETDVQKYRPIADKMKNAIQKGVIGSDGSMSADLMGAYVLPIYFDLVPEEHKQKFADALVQSIAKNDGCMDTGFLATPYLLFALDKIGRTDLACQLLWQTKCPSWLSEVEQGATTIWENNFGYDAEGNPGSLSFNHYAFGAVADWIFQREAGIVPLCPGFAKVRICPIPDERLTACKRTFQSMQGEISVDWKREGEDFTLDVTIPCNTTAQIVLPNGEEFTTGSGVYHYGCKVSVQ